MDRRSSVLEVGCGTGQATRSLAALGCPVTAVEPGAEMAALACQRLAAFGNVEVEKSTFEEWGDHGRRFDVVVAASAWHWVDPSIGWRRAHNVLRPGGWMALIGNVVVRRPGERRCTPRPPISTSDFPRQPRLGHPPLEGEVRMTDEGWGLVTDPGGLFGRRPSGGIRPFRGSTQTASRISSARRRCTAGLTAASVIPSSTRSPSGSARRWAPGHHAAT
jgi:SAM-dependent methyltransferase